MEKLIAIMGKLTRIDCIQFANIGWIYPIDYLVFMKLITKVSHPYKIGLLQI